MKIPRSRLPLSIIVSVICALALTGLIFTEDLRKITEEKEKQSNGAQSMEQDEIFFDPKECRVEKGRWIFNRSANLPYTDLNCPYVDVQVPCLRNGRPDRDYLLWQWQLDDCVLPESVHLISIVSLLLAQRSKIARRLNRIWLESNQMSRAASHRFNAVLLLEKLRGKRLIFVGDSLQRGQWQSLICMVDPFIPSQKKSMNRTTTLSVFRAMDYDASIEFYWAPFLVGSNSDAKIVSDVSKRIVRVDPIWEHGERWVGADVLVFNSYVWWMSGCLIKALWGSFSNGEEGYEEFDAVIAYKIGLKTWANWIDSNINQTKTRVFFTTASPTHMRSIDWGRRSGIRCYNETEPVRKRGYWGSGSDRRIMEVVSAIVGRMKVPVTLLNITQLSDYRKDGHTSVYTETEGIVFTEEQKADPQNYADCIHWCLPGVPDTWNKIFYAYL